MFDGCNLASLTIGAGITKITGYLKNKPTKTIWMTNTPPEQYTYASGLFNYVANDLYTSLDENTMRIYPYLSSVFNVDGIKYIIAVR